MDARLARRRREVKEQGARAGLGRLVALLMVLGLGGLATWLLLSPWLAVEHIEVSGARHSDVAGALRSAGLGAGTPLVAVRPARLERALRSDPWVAEAQVTLVLPDRVEISVEERGALARIPLGGRWVLVAADATVLEGWDGQEPLPAIALDVGPLHPGDQADSAELRGALQFLQALPGDLHPGVEIRAEPPELWAVVAGRQVRLGHPVDMAAKAAVVAAVLMEGSVPEGGVVDVLSPKRPALRQPQSGVEG
ncbi:MAG: cell division protein FtsQ/DivIB [Acidimicrobiia bacterium]